MFFKTDALKNFTNFTGKHKDFRPTTVLKRDSNTDVFLRKF